MNSAIYAGDVVHARSRPRKHRLHYRVFTLLLDLDELPALSERLRLFGHNQGAPFSFWERDHGDGSSGGLRAWVEARLENAGVALDRPQIRVLCYPRIWGYVFNPLTVYFCSDQAGNLRAILHEVSNTFGERMTYVIAVAAHGTGPVRQSCAKLHYVSPFIPMAAQYDFLIHPPDERVTVRIDEADDGGHLLRAVFSGRRRMLSDRALLRLLFAYPLMTLKVTVAIHWEALRLWLKGVPVFRHHPAKQRVATTVLRRETPDSVPNHPARDRQADPVGEQS
jgi:uncharacterized protein